MCRLQWLTFFGTPCIFWEIFREGGGDTPKLHNRGLLLPLARVLHPTVSEPLPPGWVIGCVARRVMSWMVIVVMKGCKIKALRNKTNTYIKTPVRGEEPVFVVTGRQQDVDAARREIMSAAEHFTQIRASRRHHAKLPGSVTTARRRSPSPGRPNNHRPPGSTRPTAVAPTTLGVRVPMSMVGLVVGPKGATIKRIQADTGTYIVTPGRDRDPVFEVIGSPDAVEKARQHIDAYIETRLAATSSVDQRDVSVLGPAATAAGEVWSSGELNSASSRFDLVDSRDAISRLLAMSSDCSRPHPLTPAWHLPQSSVSVIISV